MRKQLKKYLRPVCVTLIVLFLPMVGLAKESSKNNDTASDITGKCTFTLKTVNKSKRPNLTDNRIKSFVTVPVKDGEASFSVSWKETLKPGRFYLQWTDDPQSYRIEWIGKDGETLSVTERPYDRALNQWIDVPGLCREAVFSSESEMELSELRVYSEGTLPDNIHVFKDTSEKLDYLIVSAHPDDDQLFMGAVTPIYGGDRGLKGTVLFMTCRERTRYEEALNGLWVAGQRTLPLFAWNKDGGPDYKDVRSFWDFEDTVRKLVRYFREFRPEVVVTHDLNGEYGQALHRITSEAVIEAVGCAKNADYDPESINAYGTWQVKKLYIHLYGENRITLDMRSPLYAYNGKTALEVAKEAYKEHKSQQYLWFKVDDRGAYSPAEYGLYYSVVGPDTPGRNDMFEHLDGAEKEISYTVSVKDGIVKIVSDAPVSGIYLSKVPEAPAIDSIDWFPAEGNENAVYKSDGDYYLYIRYGNGKIAGGDTVNVAAAAQTVLDAKNVEPMQEPIGNVLEKCGTDAEKLNALITERVGLCGLYTRTAVAVSGVTLVNELGKLGYSVPYQGSGRAPEDLFGIDPAWGSRLERTDSDNNGKYYYHGLHCAASTVWAYRQAGLNLNSTRNAALNLMGKNDSGKNTWIHRDEGQPGDVFRTTTTHTFMIVERLDSDSDGKDDSYLILEMVNPSLVLRKLTFEKTSAYDCFDMSGVFLDTAKERKYLKGTDGTFRFTPEQMTGLSE